MKTKLKGSTVAASKEDFAKKLGALRAATGRPERFLNPCACALHDRPFLVVFERTDPSQRFLITGIYKDGDAPSDAVPKPSDISAQLRARRSWPTSLLDLTGWRCPHCGNAEEVIICQDCHTTVCAGRMVTNPGVRPVFNCRPSCGARGTLGEAEEVHGLDGARKASGPARPALPHRQALLLPKPDLLRLKGPR